MLRMLVYTATTLMLIVPPAFAAAKPPTLDDLWQGSAYFRQVRTIEWGDTPGQHNEIASWYAVRGRAWYAFSRAYPDIGNIQCPGDHARVVVRESQDQGRTWTDPRTAIEPGDSRAGDGCAVLDGSSFFDTVTRTWHILAQCMDLNNLGGWSLCHYSRKGASPVGRFTADPQNPVVRGGQLWSRICGGTAKSCPPTTYDEGTPDIIGKRRGQFIVTFHGAGPGAKSGYRGVASTVDFHHWSTSGNGLPGDAIFGPKDCSSWLKGCVGTGEVSTLVGSTYDYMVGEVMTKGLACQPDQTWQFEMYRIQHDAWPKSGAGKIEKLPGNALLTPSMPNPDTPCAVNYARLLKDGSDTYLIYEDWAPHRAYLKRRLLKLTSNLR